MNSSYLKHNHIRFILNILSFFYIYILFFSLFYFTENPNASSDLSYSFVFLCCIHAYRFGKVYAIIGFLILLIYNLLFLFIGIFDVGLSKMNEGQFLLLFLNIFVLLLSGALAKKIFDEE